MESLIHLVVTHLGPIHTKVPSSENEWLEVERRFANRWDYVNTLGAIDGKHVVMIKPRSSVRKNFSKKKLEINTKTLFTTIKISFGIQASQFSEGFTGSSYDGISI